MYTVGLSGTYFTFLSSLCPVPCGPNVNAKLDCQSQVLTLSWNATSNAEGYIVVVSNGNWNMSYTTTMPGLTITTLKCGLDYTLKVMSFNSTCVSRPTVLSIRESKRALSQMCYVAFV